MIFFNFYSIYSKILSYTRDLIRFQQVIHKIFTNDFDSDVFGFERTRTEYLHGYNARFIILHVRERNVSLKNGKIRNLLLC